MALEEYWEEFPPPYRILRMIAEGLFGKAIGKEARASFKPSSAEDVMAVLGGPGIHGR